MRTKHRVPRTVVLVGVFLVACVLLPFTFIIPDRILAPFTTHLLAPKPKIISVSQLEPLVKVSDRVHTIQWTDDGTSLEIIRSHWTAANNDNGQYVQLYDLHSNTLTKEIYVPATNTIWDDSLLARCSNQQITATVSATTETASEVTVFKKDTVIASVWLTSTQLVEGALALHPQHGAFSPDCQKLAITLGGWLYYEQEGKNELWLLDIPRQSIHQLLLGRWPFLRTFDYPVQSTRATWSPDSTQLVFGDATFGLERYSIITNTRYWLARPEFAGYGPVWSPQGHWIATLQFGATPEKPDKVILVSPDGSKVLVGPECDLITIVEWAPKGDQILYNCKSTHSNSDQQQIWLWKVPQNISQS